MLLAISFGLAAAMAAVIAVRGIGVASVEVGAAIVVACAAIALVRRPSLTAVARRADRSAALEDRLATAIDILEGRIHGELASLQLADTWHACRSLAPRHVFPTLDRRLRWAIASALFEVALAVLAMSNADLLRGWAETQFAGAAPIADVAVGTSSADLDAQLEAVSGAAPSVQLEDSAAVTSARLRDQLQQQDARSRAFEAASNKLAQALKASSAAHDVGVSLERGDYEQAAGQLRDLARESDQLSSSAKQELARSLLQVSKDSATLDQTLAVAEQSAARALGRSDYQSGRKALEDLADVVAAQQRAVIPSPEIARSLQRLQAEDITRGANNASCGGGDEYAAPVDCSTAKLYSSGAMRAVTQSAAASPLAGNGDAGRGGGYASGGSATNPLGDTITRVDAPAESVVQVDLTPSSAQGRGNQSDPKVSTTVISQLDQKDVLLNGQPQPTQPITDIAEKTIAPPAQSRVLRDFFQAKR